MQIPAPGIPVTVFAALFAAGCTAIPPDPENIEGYRQSRDDGPGVQAMVQRGTSELPRNLPKSRIGNPQSYVVFGERYHVMDSSRGFRERGVASWYGSKFHGRKTSSGETYNMYNITAAHKHLPLPTFVQVTNLDNGKRLIVKVNDRGPFVDDRIIDLSYAAAAKLGVLENGTAPVEIVAISENTDFIAEAEAAASNLKRNSGVDDSVVDDSGVEDSGDDKSAVANSDTDALNVTNLLPQSGLSALPLTPEPVDSETRATGTEAAAELSPPTVAAAVPAQQPASQERPLSATMGTIIQVGAFANRDNAETMRRRVDEIMQERAALVISDEQASIHRVQVGPLPSEAPVDEILARLQLAGIEKVTIFER